MSALLLAAILSIAPPTSVASPADGLGLAPGASPPSVATVATSPSPAPGVPVLPLGAGGLTGSLAVLAAAAAARPGGRRRSSRKRTAGRAAPPPGVVIVFVSGHGSGVTGTFDDLVRLMGARQEQTRRFDYRWLEPGSGHEWASEWSRHDDVADALHAYLAALSYEGRPIYLVGHSKGGAAIAELIARWDDDPSLAVPEVVGAALLDPPIARSLPGWLQRIGYYLGPVPDNGGYNPVHCSWFRCIDDREHLGEGAGVDVLVVRNPDAVVTNFDDEPEGLRVYDLVDDGDDNAITKLWRPGSVIGRMAEAHESVLRHPAVASCIVAETWALGSCRWTADRERMPPGRRLVWGRGRSYGPVVR